VVLPGIAWSSIAPHLLNSGAPGALSSLPLALQSLRGRMTLVAFVLLALLCLALFGFACACLSDPSDANVEFLFDGLGLIPSERDAKVVEASVTWNYTTFLNIIFLALAAVLVGRFVRTGGLPMLRRMNEPD
jgi:hypothetical protein